MQLAKRPRRCELRAFWLLMAVGIGALAGIALAWQTAALTTGAWAGLVVAGLITGVGWRRPTLMRKAYRGWNRVVERAMWVVRGGATACAYVIVVAAAACGSQIPWNAPYPSGSAWLTRRWQERSFTSASELAGDARGSGWLSSLLSWGRRPGGMWVWGLVPCLLLLTTIEPATRGSMSRDTYTLY